MPKTATGRPPGRRPHLPHVLATTLLYGRVPGIRRLGAGKLLVTYRDLGQHTSTQTTELKQRLTKLAEWGIIRKLELDRSTAMVWLARPYGWEDEGNRD